MIASKAWNWNQVSDKQWKNVSEEFLPVVLDWKNKGLKKVLDLGCGIGRNALFLAKHGFDVSAFDLSEEGLAILSRESKKESVSIDINRGDMLQLPYDDGHFQSLLAFHSIYHTDYRGLVKVIAEINRVLQRDGEIFITLNSKQSDAWKIFSERRLDEFTLLKTEGPEVDIPHTYLDYEDAISLLSGLKILKIQQIFDYWDNRIFAHFFIRCRKE